MNDIIENEWYEHLVDDCRAIITERVFNSRAELITGYGEVGERIYNDPNYKKYSHGNQNFVEKLFKDIGINKSDGYRCLQYYEKFCLNKEVSGVTETFKEGKNISWSKICHKYLPQSNGKTIEEECYCEKFMCIKCHRTYSKEEIKNLTK